MAGKFLLLNVCSAGNCLPYDVARHHKNLILPNLCLFTSNGSSINSFVEWKYIERRTGICRLYFIFRVLSKGKGVTELDCERRQERIRAAVGWFQVAYS